jgi:hypothetical protein
MGGTGGSPHVVIGGGPANAHICLGGAMGGREAPPQS